MFVLLVSLTLTAQTDSITWENDTSPSTDATVQVQEMNSVTSTAPPPSEVTAPPPERPASGLGWLVLACGLATLLSIGSGVMAFLARREAEDMQETLQTALLNTDENMRRMAEEHSREVNALRAQVARLVNQDRQKGAKPTPHGHNETRLQDDNGPKTWYLAKPDGNGVFTRVSPQFELGNSLFQLTTADGVHGTFVVIDHTDVHRFALMMPTENLTRACSGEGIQLSAGMTRIVTDHPGEAVLEGGAWHVTRKAVIHYE